MKIIVVCKYGVFRSKVLTCLLREYGMDAESRGLLNDFEGKTPIEISDTLLHVYKKFRIRCLTERIKVLSENDINKADFIVTFSENLKNRILKKFPNFGGKIIVIPFYDLKDKNLEEHIKFIHKMKKTIHELIKHFSTQQNYYI